MKKKIKLKIPMAQKCHNPQCFATFYTDFIIGWNQWIEYYLDSMDWFVFKF